MTNYFELYSLPVSFFPDQAEVKRKFYELSRTYHPDRFARTGGDKLAEAERMAAANNDAYKILRDSNSTLAYVLKLNGMLEDEEKYSLPPAFLMEMMDLNEAVSDYEADPENEAARRTAEESLSQQITQWDGETQPLLRQFNSAHPDESLLARIKDYYFRHKYLLRIQERMATFAARR